MEKTSWTYSILLLPLYMITLHSPKCYDAEGQDPVEGVDEDDVHHVERADHRAAEGGPEFRQKLSRGSLNLWLWIRARYWAWFIIDGCSFQYAHTWSKSGILIC